MSSVLVSNSSSTAQGLRFDNMPKTTIILSDLPKSVFVAQGASKVTKAEEIKIACLNFAEESYKEMQYFAALSKFQRIVVIMKNEVMAKELYEYLKQRFGYKTNLSETLITDSMSQQTYLNAVTPVIDSSFTNNGKGINGQFDNFIANYEEPMPQEQDSKKSLRICTDCTELLGSSPESPSITLESYDF